jgi:hypothetical protein
VKRSPGLGLVMALIASYLRESQMAKSTQFKKAPAATARQVRSSLRSASKKSPAAVVIKTRVPAGCGKSSVRPTGKIAIITSLLRRPKGASIDDLRSATGWQAHSVRGAISGSIKEKLRLTVFSEKRGAVRLYRIDDKCAD